MIKLIWWGLAYMLIFIERIPDVLKYADWGADQRPEYKAIDMKAGQYWTLEAQNFGFCLLPAN